MNVLLDTNVVLDALQSREPFRQEAEEILMAAAGGKLEASLTTKALLDIYYLTHRLTHSKEQTRSILSKLLEIVTLLDTTAIDCQKALLSPMADFEDAVMAETALRCRMDGIVTRNGKDFTRAPLPIFTPTELLHQLASL